MLLAAICLASTLFAPVKQNHSLLFTEDRQVAVVPYQAQLELTTFTLECWIYMDPSAKERYINYILSRNYGGAGYGIAVEGWGIKRLNGDPKPLQAGRWVHVASVHAPPIHKLYVDGELASVDTNAARPDPIRLPLKIGNSDFVATPGNQSTCWRGRIDEVRIWKVALSQQQIKSRMGRYLRGTEKGLVAYFTFDEGQGQLVRDVTGHLVSGSLGQTYREGPDDPGWAEGVPLRGHPPRIRERRR